MGYCILLKRIPQWFWYCLASVLLIACAAPPKVAVEERQVLTNRQEVEQFGGELIRFAQPGDSLHGIAFVYGLKVDRLAAWNGLEETEKLLIGQRIRLTSPIGFRMPEPSKPVPESQTKIVIEPLTTPDVDEQAPANNSLANQTETVSTIVNSQQWLWPVRGSISQRFQPSSGKQGINIQSQLGENVRAARAGQVVYSGSSLKGYGNLIIVKHDELYLSAYAFTQNVRVSEGDFVQASQQIASIGRDNVGASALHFQIRKDGVPIDPLTKLPKS